MRALCAACIITYTLASAYALAHSGMPLHIQARACTCSLPCFDWLQSIHDVASNKKMQLLSAGDDFVRLCV